MLVSMKKLLFTTLDQEDVYTSGQDCQEMVVLLIPELGPRRCGTRCSS